MVTKVVTVTSKGQITLPKVWRDRFCADQFLLLEEKRGLLVKPVDIDEIETLEDLDKGNGYNVIFNAKRDNGGKGIPAGKLLKLLEKINGQN